MKKNSLSWSISFALFGTAITLVPQLDVHTAEVECDHGDCEAPAPYTLKIITHGEGDPKAANDTPAGLQQNRRVDVTLETKVPGKETPPPAAAAAKPVAVLSDRRDPDDPEGAENGGTFWVSEDPTSFNKLLGLEVPEKVSLGSDGALENPVQFSIATNYSNYIDRWQILILPEGSDLTVEPLYSVDGVLSGSKTTVEWNGEFIAGDRLQAGDKYDVALRVYNKKGYFDQIASRTIAVVSEGGQETADNSGDLESRLELTYLRDELEQISQEFVSQSIPVAGSTVVLRGTDLDGVQTVDVNGEKIAVAGDDSFAIEYILPPGDHEFNVRSRRKSGEESSRTLDVEVKPGHFFVVALADVTVGENSISGSVEPLAADDDHFGGDIFVDGRLAFYLKGKVKGKYLITAQMDTGTEDISELFDDVIRSDQRGLFRRIDPDQYYLVYGDDSTVTQDTDSQGKIYLRVDWDKSHALWGNFNTAFSGTEYAPFNRSLYGGQYTHSSLDTTTLGDNRTEISAFVSEPQTAFRHNEFSGTGGSLYYLRDQDIVLGSEKVWVEVRRDDSEQVIQRIALEPGRDYEIDEFQGRIILTRPLLSVSSEVGPSIIRDEPQAGDKTFLVVDYEYVPVDFSGGDATVGARGRRWINNHIAIGGTFAHEGRETDDYSVKAFDVTVKKSDRSFLRFELADSESSVTSGSFGSDDGGLTFTPFNSNTGAASGTAIGVEATIAANDFIELDTPVSVDAWAKRRDAGFSTANLDAGVDVTDTGVEVVAEVSNVLSISGRALRLEKETQSRESLLAVQGDYKYTDKTTVSGEVRHINDRDLSSGTSESATLAAGKVAVQLSDSLDAYGVVQGVLDRSGNYQDNSQLVVGANARIDERLSVSGELSTGDRGTNLLLGAEHHMSDTYSIYSNVNLLNDRSDSLERTLTLGQRKTVSEKLKVYTEHQFSTEDARRGLTNTIGLSNTFNRYATGTLSFQSSRIEDEFNEDIERDTVTAGFSFKRKKSFLAHKLEFRKDRSENVDTDQWVTVTNVEHRHSPSLRLQGRFNHSSTEDNIANDNAEFTEAGLGFAYRPVTNDRLNLLGRYTFLRDLPPLSQSGETEKRSSIVSMEGIYELGRRWTVGGKFARREGKIRASRQSGEFIGNDASLAAIRLRYKAHFGVDGLVSYQWLNSDATDSLRQGALMSLGYNIAGNLQFSVGYNFTAFDDNLGNSDYDVRGWFFNLVGKY